MSDDTFINDRREAQVRKPKSLRDEFAMAALHLPFATNRFIRATAFQEIAAFTYEIADAMLEAREK